MKYIYKRAIFTSQVFHPSQNQPSLPSYIHSYHKQLQSHQTQSIIIQFTNSTISALAFFLLSLPTSIIAGVCQPNEISVGVIVACQLGNPPGGGCCNYEAALPTINVTPSTWLRTVAMLIMLADGRAVPLSSAMEVLL